MDFKILSMRSSATLHKESFKRLLRIRRSPYPGLKRTFKVPLKNF